MLPTIRGKPLETQIELFEQKQQNLTKKSEI